MVGVRSLRSTRMTTNGILTADFGITEGKRRLSAEEKHQSETGEDHSERDLKAVHVEVRQNAD